MHFKKTNKQKVPHLSIVLLAATILLCLNLYSLHTTNDLHSYWGIIANLLVQFYRLKNKKNTTRKKILIVCK
jgi:hypothetical protein